MPGRLNSIPAGLAVFPVALALVGGMPAAPPVTSSFTDSQGLTVLYRYSLRDDWNPAEVRGLLMYFHGQATTTREGMLGYMDMVRPEAWERGLVPVVVASSRADRHDGALFASVTGFGTRYWYPEDARLVHELLQTGLGEVLSVDYDRVFFWGDSLGPCFLTYFLEKYGGIYGGGLYARCGCFWGDDRERAGVRWTPSVHWTPAAAAALRGRFRVFVQTTTEDFLHAESVLMRDYYKDTLGLPTRSDLDAPGGHCAEGAVSPGEALDWLVGGLRIPSPAAARSATDIDGDGLENGADPDADGDGAADVIDSAPLDPREWLDSDADGIGDFADSDADGDGVDNALDAFPGNRREWLDFDGDGIGDNVDSDDDGDGVPDSADPQPQGGAAAPAMVFQNIEEGYYGWPERGWPLLYARMHLAMPAGYLYPKARGGRQFYQYITLGDGPAADVQVMVDRFELSADPASGTLVQYEYDPRTINLIYIDLNGNGNLTDDGPPSVAPSEASGAAMLEVRYSSGEVVPYGVRFRVDSKGGLLYRFNSSWLGEIATPYGAPVLAGAADSNGDGLFGLPDRRYAPRLSRSHGTEDLDTFCVDLNRDTNLFCWDAWWYEAGPEAVSPENPFLLDGQFLRASLAPSGRTVALEFEGFMRDGGEGVEPVPPPRIADGGIVLADQYSGATTAAPGAVARALGTGFARPVARARGSLDEAGRVGGRIFDVCLEVNGIRAPLFHVSEKGITFQVPAEVRPGPARVEVVVECDTDRERRSEPAIFRIVPRRPVFLLAARSPPVILNSKLDALPPAAGLDFPSELATGPLPPPLRPGEVAVLYGTGFGATGPEARSGELAPGRRPLSASDVRVRLGRFQLAPGDIRYAGSSPGYAGVNELHVRIPDGTPPGRADVVVSIDGFSSARGPYVEIAPRDLPAAGQRFRDCAECPEMVVVPAGSFLMGAPEAEPFSHETERPVRRVVIERPFAVGVYEVTFAEWDACAADGGCHGHRPDDRGWGRGSRPVMDLTWEQAQAYPAWLSRKTGQTYRLPSEAEWEYAVRAWTQTAYSFGDSILPSQANYWGRGERRTLPVGSFEPNAFGLFDMHGNAAEWVQDCWHPTYAGAPTNGSAWESGPCQGRVERGGSHDSGGLSLRAAVRFGWHADHRHYSLGFRVARTLLP